MKLAEIINSSHFQAEPDQVAVDAISDRLATEGRPVKSITKQTDLVQLGVYYGARRGNEIIAWVELGNPVILHGVEYDTISFIFIKSAYRGSFAAGTFLLALKGELTRPLLLGSDEYGGVLFAGGEALVRSLHRSAHFEVSVLDLKTGKKMPFSTDDLQGSKGKTLVFEMGNFPMYHDAGAAGRFYLFND